MIYDYKCPECGHKEEDVLVKRHDEQVDCPNCKTKMQKQFSVFSFDIGLSTAKMDGYKPGRGDARFGRL